MDHAEVGRLWNANVDGWTKLVRAGGDLYRDYLNTPAFFEILPDVDGLLLVKFFRANRSTRDIPMIVLSSREEPATKAQAFALGDNDYLVKLAD